MRTTPTTATKLIDGELVTLPPESEPNNAIVSYLFLVLVNSGIPWRVYQNTYVRNPSSDRAGGRTQLTVTPIWWFCGQNTSC